MEDKVNKTYVNDGDVIFINAKDDSDMNSEELINYAKSIKDSFPNKEVRVVVVPKGIEIDVSNKNADIVDSEGREVLLEEDNYERK